MFIGRTHELSLIRKRLADHTKAQMIVLYGRRRVGKSTLIQESAKDEPRVLNFEGIEGENTQAQISQFLTDLAQQTGRVRLGARTWSEVFQGLGEIIEKGRWVLVFDEFPWLGAGRTAIVSQLKLYWDRWSRNPQVALFLCGSVASFMVRHVVHSKALHNRKTLEMCLSPLSPTEAGRFISHRSNREKALLYMTLGGVPKYLEQIDERLSVRKNLNQLCFSADGFFLTEYETLFKEQFRSLKVYGAIVASLATAPASLSELGERIGVSKGGGFGDQLQNLVRAQFVREYKPLRIGRTAGTRTRLYKLIDPFLLFYFRYIHENRELIGHNRHGEDLFSSIVGPSIHPYCGLAFERLGEASIDRILGLLNLKLADIKQMGTFFRQTRTAGGGLQIDWLIVRHDGVWNLLEFKYASRPSGLEVMHQVQEKIRRLDPPNDVTIEPVLVSAPGCTKALQTTGFFQHTVTLADLMD